MEGNPQDEEDVTANLNRQSRQSPIPDLALNLQAMSLADPGLCQLQDTQEVNDEELDFSYCLLMKIACTSGMPRKISQQAVEALMKRAWRNRFYAISQVSTSIFMAHFKSQDDRVWVYMKQPWAVGRDNLLLEWFEPGEDANSSVDYNFDTILVTIRAYGIPRNKRSTNLLVKILNQVGEVSKFHIIQDNNLYAKQDYIWGTTKLEVEKPIKDRAVVTYTDGSSGTAYLHYEKIERVCLFYGIMFHTAQACSLRSRLVSESLKSKQLMQRIPEFRFGQWIMDEDHIPHDVIQNTRSNASGNNQTGSSILGKLQKMFSEDPKGKMQARELDPPIKSTSAYQTMSQRRDRPLVLGQHRQEMERNMQTELAYTVPEAGQTMRNSSSRVIQALHQSENPSEMHIAHDSTHAEDRQALLAHQWPPGQSILVNQDNDSLRNAQKRPAPAASPSSVPQAKISSQPYKKALATGSNIEPPMLTTLLALPPSSNEAITEPIQNYGPDLNAILHNTEVRQGEHLNDQHQLRNDESLEPERARRRPSGWDIAVAPANPNQPYHSTGTTSYHPSAFTWRSNKEKEQQRNERPTRRFRNMTRGNSSQQNIPSSAGHNPLRRESSPYVHEPFHLIPNSPAESVTTPDSRGGAFSPPPMLQDYYVMSDELA